MRTPLACIANNAAGRTRPSTIVAGGFFSSFPAQLSINRVVGNRLLLISGDHSALSHAKVGYLHFAGEKFGGSTSSITQDLEYYSTTKYLSRTTVSPSVEIEQADAENGTTEPVSRDQILRRERGQGKTIFPCSADHKQDWPRYSVDPYSAILCM